MKWGDLERGPAEGRLEDFPAPGGKTIQLRIVPLFPTQDVEIAAGARSFAEKNKGEIKAGDPIYELGAYVETLLRAVLDPDDGKPFFASTEEVRELDRDRIALLFELQQQVQADYAPRIGKMTAAEFFSMIERTAEADEGERLPFESLPRVTQRNFVHSIAKSYKELTLAYGAALSLIGSQKDSSSPGQDSPAITTN